LLKTENPVYCSEADCLILIKESGWEPNCVKGGILALLKSGSLIKRGRNYWALLKVRTSVSRFSFVEKRIFDKKIGFVGFVEKSGLGLVEYLCWKRF
jgi:hypothetical protein